VAGEEQRRTASADRHDAAALAVSMARRGRR
jgi:hypothetical protein